MNPPSIRLRTAPMIVLAGIMIAASLIASSPASAAKTRPTVSVFCFGTGEPQTPGYARHCDLFVLGPSGAPQPTGTVKLSAAASKGTLSTTSCSVGACHFTYTPKGTGSNTRKDTVTAAYSGDVNYSARRSSTKVQVLKSPPAQMTLSCQETVQAGASAFCTLSYQIAGSFETRQNIALTAPSYKGTVAPESCFTVFSSSCTHGYTPKGRGSDTRVDKITASYPGDVFNSPAKVTETIKVTPAP